MKSTKVLSMQREGLETQSGSAVSCCQRELFASEEADCFQGLSKQFGSMEKDDRDGSLACLFG